MWKLIQKKDKKKPSKVPYTVENKEASPINPATWDSYENCAKALESGLYQGIGFVFSSNDNFVGYDVDDVRSPETGQISPEILQEIKILNSYTELSQSGKGIHVIFKGKKPGERCRHDCREMYEEKRFFVVTGNHLEGTPANINIALPEAINIVYEKLTPHVKSSSADFNTKSIEVSEKIADNDIISLCKSAKNADKFNSLWAGDIAAYNEDNSRADQALCSILAFYTQDEIQIDRLFRKSGLYRSKWEREDYKERTIKKAISGLREVYRSFSKKDSQIQNTAEVFQHKEFPVPSPFGGEKGNTFMVKEIGEYVLNQVPCRTFKDTDELLYYHEGVYRRGGEIVVGQIIQNILGNRSRKNFQNEVINWIKHATYTDRETFNPKFKINLLNGILDLSTEELIPHSPESLFTMQSPIIYDHEATCPKINQFLNDMMDDKKIATVHEFVGYSLTTDTNIQKAMIVYGEAESGKSTLLNLCTAFVGEDNTSNESLHNLENDKFAVSSLCDKTLNVCPDLPEKPLSDLPIFKQIVGGDRLRAEIKYRPAFTFKPTVKLLFSANKLPSIKNFDDAKSRRLILIKIKKSVPLHKRNLNLLDELTTKEELSGFLNLALKGLQKLLSHGYYSYNTSTDATKLEYMRTSSPIESFLKECVEYCATKHIGKKEMYNSFCKWCEFYNVETFTIQQFSRKLSGVGYQYKRETNGKREWYWCECSFSKTFFELRDSL